ncbi:BamA/TamA family outer membrane protein [Luteitalea pratensis]|uniref:BamA/TamA family outer membrane protein n=1 Tax=Luteitalea pratensis TaxID=1855912 RepID=UPI0012FF84B4|nr:BamA/TamA family outer membrane protein [Luteitalea pratensis]
MTGAGRGRGRRAARLALLLTTLFAGTSRQAAAQEAEPTRAAEAEAVRRAKAEALADAPPPNKVERAFGFVESSRLLSRIFNPPRGWFAQIGGVGEGNGFTLGGGYRQPTPAGVLTLRGLGSIRRSHLFEVELTRAFLPREAGFVTGRVQRRHEAAQRFYGQGPDSEFDDKTSFGLSATLVDATAGVHVTRWLTGSAGVGYANPDIKESSESSSVPPTQGAYDDLSAPGLFFQPEYVTSHVEVAIDTRNAGNPRRGGLYQAQLRRFDDREGGAYSFADMRIELQHYIPFWNLSRVLALRALAQHADGLGQAQVPFYVMPTLGGARTLRGYERQRFRDRSLLLLSAEYRYEVNPFLMTAVFYDAGQVAPDWSDFALKDMRDNYGFGLRFGSSNAVAFRADLAFGGEDSVRFIFGFASSF